MNVSDHWTFVIVSKTTVSIQLEIEQSQHLAYVAILVTDHKVHSAKMKSPLLGSLRVVIGAAPILTPSKTC